MRVSICPFLLLFNILYTTAAVTAPCAETTPGCDSVAVFTQKVFFPKVSAVVSRDFAGNGARIDSIISFLSSGDTRDFLSVTVTGSHSPEGKADFNTRLSRARAAALSDLVREINPALDPVTAVRHPAKDTDTDYPLLRNAELQIRYRNNAVAPGSETDRHDCTNQRGATSQSDNGDTPRPMTETQCNYPPLNALDTISASLQADGATAATPALPPSRHHLGSRLFVTTNMLYDAALTPDIGVGLRVSDKVSVLADWMYARWNNRDRRRYWRIYGGDIEVRYRLAPGRSGSPLAGHHLGAYASMACYDFQAGRSHSGILSDKYNYAVGLSYTYTLPLSPRFNIDFSLGVGYLWGTYKKHTPIDDCDVWLSTHRLHWFGPTRAGVTLVWLVGNGVKNNTKGGAR